MLDIPLSFLTPYEREDSTYEGNVKKIANKYVRKQLIIDTIAAFPTAALESGIELATTTNSYRFLKDMEITNSIINISRVSKSFKVFKYNAIISKLITSKFTNTEARMILTLLFSFFLVHIFACIFYLESRL